MGCGVPQCTLSGPESFLSMTVDLHRYVDDVVFVDYASLYDVCNLRDQSKLQNAADDIS